MATKDSQQYDTTFVCISVRDLISDPAVHLSANGEEIAQGPYKYCFANDMGNIIVTVTPSSERFVFVFSLSFDERG